jgi:hypothetical protein
MRVEGSTPFWGPAQAFWARRAWVFAFTLSIGTAVTIMVAHSFVAKWSFKGDFVRDGLVSMMDGTADRPFVYRRLAPDLVRVATDFSLPRLPKGTLDFIVKESPLARYRWFWGGESWNERKALAFHFAFWLTWAALFGTLQAGAALYRFLRGSSWVEAMAFASLVMCLLPLTFTGGGYLYDAPELCLWTTLLFVAIRGWLPAVPLVFALMLVNKESALLAVPALFPILAHHAGRKRAAIWVGLLGVAGYAWGAYVRARYAALPGTPMAWLLKENLTFWAQPRSYFLFSTNYAPAFPAPRGANVLNLILLFVPVCFGWKSTRPDLKWAAITMTAVLLPFYLTGGFADEIRALSLLFPLVLIPAAEGVHAILRAQTEKAPAAPVKRALAEPRESAMFAPELGGIPASHP